MSGLSTETIRKIYADGDAENEWFFDTWLAKHDSWTVEAERKRIIRLLQEPYWHNLRSPGIHEDCKMCETIWLIDDRNIL